MVTNVYLETSRFVLIGLKFRSILQGTINQERYTCHDFVLITKTVDEYREKMIHVWNSGLSHRVKETMGANQQVKELLSTLSKMIDNELFPMIQRISSREIDCDAEGHVC